MRKTNGITVVQRWYNSPWEFFEQYKDDAKMFYILRIAVKSFTECISQTTSERCFKIAKELIGDKATLLNDESITRRHKLMEEIRRGTVWKGNIMADKNINNSDDEDDEDLSFVAEKRPTILERYNKMMDLKKQWNERKKKADEYDRKTKNISGKKRSRDEFDEDADLSDMSVEAEDDPNKNKSKRRKHQ